MIKIILVDVVTFIILSAFVWIPFLIILPSIIRNIKFKNLAVKYNLKYESRGIFDSTFPLKRTVKRSVFGKLKGDVVISDVKEAVPIARAPSNFLSLLFRFRGISRESYFLKYYTVFAIDNVEKKVSKGGYTKINEIESWLKAI